MTSTCSSGFKTFLWSLFEAHPRVVSQLQQYIYTFPHSHSHSVHDDNNNYNDDDNTVYWLINNNDDNNDKYWLINNNDNNDNDNHQDQDHQQQQLTTQWPSASQSHDGFLASDTAATDQRVGAADSTAEGIGSAAPGGSLGLLEPWPGMAGMAGVLWDFFLENRGWRWIWRQDGCLTRFDAFFLKCACCLVVWNMAFIFP